MKQRKWLVEKRNDANLTQKEVADLTHIKRPYYTQIELGVRTPSVKVAKKIASVIGFDWTVFFEKICSDLEQNKNTA